MSVAEKLFYGGSSAVFGAVTAVGGIATGELIMKAIHYSSQLKPGDPLAVGLCAGITLICSCISIGMADAAIHPPAPSL